MRWYQDLYLHFQLLLVMQLHLVPCWEGGGLVSPPEVQSQEATVSAQYWQDTTFVARPTRPSSKAVFAASSNLAPCCRRSLSTIARHIVSSSSFERRIWYQYCTNHWLLYLQASPVGIYTIGGDFKVFTYLDGEKMLAPVHESFNHTLRTDLLVSRISKKADMWVYWW